MKHVNALTWTFLLLGCGWLGAPVSAAPDPVTATIPAVIDAAAQRTVVATTAQYLSENYIFPDVGDRAATLLKDNLKSGRYDGLQDKNALAQRLTDDIRSIAHDLHVRVFPDSPPDASGSDSGEQGPFMFSSVDLLKGNVGYIDLRGFLPRDIFAVGANSAMRSLADTDALILDLRHNHGGDPAAVAYLVSFFVDAKSPVHVNDVIWRQPKTEVFDRQTFFTTPTPVNFGDKPVYVITSGDTFSGGEEFPYDMQGLKRAVIVGQTTGGGANPGRALPVGQGLSVFIPGGRAENPITKSNWEGTGVKPDIITTAPDAFTATYAAALSVAGRGHLPGRVKSIADVVQEHRLSIRTTPQPGGDAAVRRQVAGLAEGKQPLDLFSPSMADALKGPVPADIQATIVALGTLKKVNFSGVNWVGEDVYDLEFAHGGLMWNNLLNEDRKVVSAYFTPKE
jgi:hypothetical protein